MGAYLSEPKLDKDSADGSSTRLSYGVSAMQGWRISMEDAHNCIPEFDEKTALFAVYDGHGGAEVAEYCAKYLPEHLQAMQLYKDGNLKDALQEGFLSFDEKLTQEEVINELKQLAGLSEDEQNEQEIADDPEDEASLLKQEADMSIEEILARYGKAQNKATAALRKKNKFQSPVVRKTHSRVDGNCTENGESEGSQADGNCSKVETSAAKPEVSEASSTSSSFTKAEKSERRDSSENEAKPKTTANGEGDACPSSHTATAEDSAVGSSCAGSSEVGAGDATSSNSGPCSSSSVAKVQGSSSEGEGSAATPGQGSSSGGEGSSSVQETAEDNGCSSVSSSTGGKGKGKGKKSAPAGEAGGSGSDSAPRGSRAPPDSSEEEEEESEEDSDDMFDEDDSEEDSDDLDDDDDDEDGEEEEEEDADEGPIIFSDKEQPGSDSGTTAVVALLSQEKLYVGNAGDSRCVLCRAGRAIDMSIDHKPEDEEERDRILKAGGKVTQDGRVNGGLNLSRAIGDHCYKRNEDLPLKEQMITSLPDVRSIDMQPEDEFMVLACDGIWNVLTSQQVVDFVRNRLAEETPDGGKRTLSSICEELFDLCLAPDTTGDGTGCDNMTCIVVKLHNSQSAAKRPLESGQSEASQAKKPRPDEPDTSSG
ncbi:protein phosphatase 1G-like isoform X2 [Branchiostoma lanceolatum]|uniref:protein phosphatase 1G-like isoform X2 n=1 Tax=Branchiostoma lanceolatum TaxID=7740 RepID=UPI00345192AA